MHSLDPNTDLNGKTIAQCMVWTFIPPLIQIKTGRCVQVKWYFENLWETKSLMKLTNPPKKQKNRGIPQKYPEKKKKKRTGSKTVQFLQRPQQETTRSRRTRVAPGSNSHRTSSRGPHLGILIVCSTSFSAAPCGGKSEWKGNKMCFFSLEQTKTKTHVWISWDIWSYSLVNIYQPWSLATGDQRLSYDCSSSVTKDFDVGKFKIASSSCSKCSAKLKISQKKRSSYRRLLPVLNR